MNTSEVTETFLELVEQSELLTSEQFAAFTERLGDDDSRAPEAVADRLVEEGLLTPFQARRLLEGRARGFFIDDYKLLDVLGTGGMGGVYVAEQMQTGHKVALKILSEKHQHDSGMLARLKLEALAGSRLKHPHIVKTYGIGHTGAIDYLVMEYVEGITLQELVTLQGRRPWPQACDFVAQAACGLQHAHQAGLVHRDIKPSNLLILRDGGVKILDFGLALVSDQEDNEFSLAMIFGHDCIGSVDYMAPEQSWDSSHVDARADIYSLGCTLYSALTGAFPFPAESASKMIEAHRTQTAKPLRELASDVPVEVAAVVEKMMAKSPQERYRTAAEVQQALRPFAKRIPVEFDFEAVLAARAEEEKRRSAAYRRRQSGHRSRSRAKSSLTTATTAGAKTDRVEQPSSTESESEQRRSESRTGRTEQPTIAQGDSRAKGRGDSATVRLSDRPIVPPSDSPVPRAMLVSLDGGPPIPVTSEHVLIGRSSDCDVQLPEGGVSGRHCELCLEGGWWRITDLNSKNGTRVNGVPINDQLLCSGDRLTIAEQYQFRFQTGPGVRSVRRSPWTWIVLGLLAALAASLAVWWLW